VTYSLMYLEKLPISSILTLEFDYATGELNSVFMCLMSLFEFNCSVPYSDSYAREDTY